LPIFDGTSIRLVDQFEDQVHTITGSVEFCNPTTKDPPNNPDELPLDFLPHLRCWQIDSPGGSLDITFEVLDQFFATPHEHTIGAAVEFCHTVDKAPGVLNDNGDPIAGAGPFPGTFSTTIQNWKCYTITGDPPTEPNRNLVDQFTIAAGLSNPVDTRFPNATIIGDPILFCAPAVKTYGLAQEPIPSDLTNHIICYDIPNETEFTALEISLLDQFTDRGNLIVRLDKMCTDGVKILPIAGTFIPLNSVIILLAGAQMSAVWILPALVSATGIAYGIEIARKYHKDTK